MPIACSRVVLDGRAVHVRLLGTFWSGFYVGNIYTIAVLCANMHLSLPWTSGSACLKDVHHKYMVQTHSEAMVMYHDSN